MHGFRPVKLNFLVLMRVKIGLSNIQVFGQVKMALLKLFVLAMCFLIKVKAENDDTLIDRKIGSEVVKAVVDKIRDSEIFLTDDKQFLMRVAYVETGYGTDGDTFDSNGGLWNAYQTIFEFSQAAEDFPELSAKHELIKSHFGIDWSTVIWEDLTKPLYSGLAARLYFFIVPIEIPWSVEEQAVFWKDYYNYEADTSTLTFINRVSYLSSFENLCHSAGADIIFVLDASGSVSPSNFLKVLNFTVEVVDYFEVGATKARFGAIVYSTDLVSQFYLNSYYDKESLKNALRQMGYTGRGTNTHLAIDYMSLNGFNETKGARNPREGVPRIGILVTDGQSNKPEATSEAAVRAHAAGITMFAVGIIDASVIELNEIGSDPDSQHVFILNDFDVVESINNLIATGACQTAVPISVGAEIVSVLEENQYKFVQVEVDPEVGATFQIIMSQGVSDLYISTAVRTPSNAIHDYKVSSDTRSSGLVLIPKETASTVYGSIKGISSGRNEFTFKVIEGVDYNNDDSSAFKNTIIIISVVLGFFLVIFIIISVFAFRYRTRFL